ncbi:MAG TPA: hypothetical protein VG675_09050 [Bryobacteraceae bacterium]|nr:hypothetical protein [Bryobacteraceae bacterium]
MRPLLALAFIPALLCAAPALDIVNPVLSLTEGNVSDPTGTQYTAGEILYFNCHIAGFQKSEDEQVHVNYTIDAVDPNGVPLMEPAKDDIAVEVTSHDKEWLPKAEARIVLPPLAMPGTYKVVVHAQDLLAKTSAEKSFPFSVTGLAVEPSDSLIVRDFHFYRSETDLHPMEKVVYRPGNSLWARFSIIGYKYGPKNKIDVSYVTSVFAGDKQLWKQPEPAVEQSESFYPKRYIPANFNLDLQKNIAPGVYTIAVEVTDAVGKQTYVLKQDFTVE